MRGRPIIGAGAVGGLNLRDGDDAMLKAGDSGRMLNVWTNEHGARSPRDGDTELDLAPDLTGAEPFSSVSRIGTASGAGATVGVEHLLLGINDGASNKLYLFDGTNGLTEIATGLTGLVWSWIEAPASGGQGPYYGVAGGIGNPLYWGGSTGTPPAAWTASGGTLPSQADQILYHANRIWALGHGLYDLRWSELGNPRDWPAANINEFDPDDGDPLTGMGIVPAGIVVFKQGKGWLVYDLDTGANRPLAFGVGAVAWRTIAESPYGAIFLSRDRGVCITDGSTVKRISEKIDPLLQSVSGSLENATAVYWRDKYLLSLGDALTLGSESVLLEYDFTLDAWAMHTSRCTLLATASLSDPAEEPRLYGAGGNGSVGVVDRLMDPAADKPDAYWRSPYHQLAGEKARVRAVTFTGSGTFGARLYKDWQDPGLLVLDPWVEQAPTVVTADSGERGEKKIADSGLVESLAVEVFSEGTDWLLDRYAIYATGRRD
jgi:hypothetical protein